MTPVDRNDVSCKIYCSYLALFCIEIGLKITSQENLGTHQEETSDTTSIAGMLLTSAGDMRRGVTRISDPTLQNFHSLKTALC